MQTSKTKDPAAAKKSARKTRSNNDQKRKIIKTHDFPQTRHLKVCLGFSGFGGTICSAAFGLSSVGSCVA